MPEILPLAPEPEKVGCYQLPPVEINGQFFKFHENFGTAGVSKEAHPIFYQRRLNDATVHFDLARRGLGFVPEWPAVDAGGNVMPETFAFYHHPAIAYKDLTTFYDWLHDKIPGAFGSATSVHGECPALSLAEVRSLADRALEETGLQDKLQAVGLA